MKLKLGSWSLTPYLLDVILVGLQACGGGGGTPPPAADPIGYYTGTFNYSSPTGQAGDTAVQAIVDSDKFMMTYIDGETIAADLTKHILYVGTFTNITATTYTADVKIYANGEFSGNAVVSNGLITEGASMSGTLSGTGNYTDTSFSLSYDTTINARVPLEPATEEANTERWLDGPTDSGIIFTAPSTITVNFFDDAAMVPVALKGCDSTAVGLTNVASEQPGRIRKTTASITGTTCNPNISDFLLDVYITPFDNGADDNRYLFISYNDSIFYVGILQ